MKSFGYYRHLITSNNKHKKYILTIKNTYLEILEREPDDSALEHFLILMKSGKIDESKLKDFLKNSSEFQSLLLSKKFSKIIKNTYLEILKREPDPNELTKYIILMKSSKLDEQNLNNLLKSSPTESSLLLSKKFSKIIKNTYLEILKREPDPNVLNKHTILMKSGIVDELKLSHILSNTSEYRRLHPNYLQKKPKLSIKELFDYGKNLDKIDYDFPEPKIVAMYRIKNEERWIKKSLEATSEICQEIVILDDGSTDDTLKICKECPNVVDIHHQEDLPYDHVRDYNLLLKMALRRKPDFTLTMAGDEIFMPNMKKILLEELTLLYSESPVFAFHFLYMWENPNQYRIDGIYSDTWDKRLMRIKDPNENLQLKRKEGFLTHHSPTIADDISYPVWSNVKILHYGNYDESLRKQKYEFWNKFDPKNDHFDNYKHIISANTKYSGKEMEFATLPERMFVRDIK